MFNLNVNIAAAIAAEVGARDANQMNVQPDRQINAQIRNALDPFNLENEEFRKKFRLSKGLAQQLCHEILRLLPDEGPTSEIPKHLQVLITLHFYATGSYQQTIADLKHFCISQPTVSRIIKTVTEAIVTLSDDYIRFPHTVEELERISEGFERESGFPGIVGCIDCTRVIMTKPRGHNDAWIFKDYKNNYSLNIQVTCDDKMRVTSIDSYPGRAHDARVWNQSDLLQTMERFNQEAEESYFLLGDSGYPLSTSLITPIKDTEPDSPEFRYTRSHCHTRSTVERVFGLLKERFRCLHKDRVLMYTPEKVKNYFIACVILHNKIIDERLQYEDDPRNDDFQHQRLHFDKNLQGNRHIEGQRLRQELINQFFL